MPVMVKILVSLAIIVAVQRLTGKLLAGVAAGTLLLAFWSGHTFHSFARVLATSFLSKESLDNYMLLGIIFLVIWFSSQLSVTGVMKDLTGAVTGVFSRRTAMAVLPALIGLLPMPGGALFSAPLVDDCDDRKEIDNLLKTKINYWFRHIWEYWWPLYPGAIVAMDITGLDPAVFIAAMFPLSVLSVLTGRLFFLGKIARGGKKGATRFEAFLRPLFPIGVLLAVYVVIQMVFPFMKNTSKYLPMALGIVGAITAQQIAHPISTRKWFEILVSKKAFEMAAIVAIIRIYGAFIEAQIPGGDFLITQLRTEMAAAGIPPLLLIIALPFVASLTSGIAVGFVGASLPIVMQLIGEHPSTAMVVSTAVLAYGSGYIALLLSPVHVCLIVTNEHFKTSLIASLKGMIPPAAVLFAGICLWAYLIRMLF
ncbi:MAG: DUF401 family protein [Chitinispirillaceae bacterium]|nr:DUF401 family protein [Chitinispirillaceae bacterium]